MNIKTFILAGALIAPLFPFNWSYAGDDLFGDTQPKPAQPPVSTQPCEQYQEDLLQTAQMLNRNSIQQLNAPDDITDGQMRKANIQFLKIYIRQADPNIQGLLDEVSNRFLTTGELADLKKSLAQNGGFITRCTATLEQSQDQKERDMLKKIYGFTDEQIDELRKPVTGREEVKGITW